ncbi:hypothetical protein [Actinoplanes sp. NPDC089786]|uniref:hypothetical protein n=1 Tax=Actinoplanes sp. NPDC089786 TaxID=3155185 RepID=UPI00343112A7
MARDNRTAVKAGRVVALLVLAVLAAYLYTVGLEKAKTLAAIGGGFIALAALLGPYLMPARPPAVADRRDPGPGLGGSGPYDMRNWQAVQINQSGDNHQKNEFR